MGEREITKNSCALPANLHCRSGRVNGACDAAVDHRRDDKGCRSVTSSKCLPRTMLIRNSDILPSRGARRELRVAVVSMLLRMVIGAAVVTVGAGHAGDSDGASSNAQPKSSRSDTLLQSGNGPDRAIYDRWQRPGEFRGSNQALSNAEGASADETSALARIRSTIRRNRSRLVPRARPRTRTNRLRCRRRRHRKREKSRPLPNPPPR